LDGKIGAAMLNWSSHVVVFKVLA